jgi:dihydrofolate reductase
MRKIAAFLAATLDGYYEGPNQEFDWPVVDEEFNQFSIQQLDESDTLVFGRRTYELMSSYWPTPAAAEDDPQVTERMNSLDKIVVSRTLDKAEWANTRLIKDDVAEQFTKLKQQPGKDLLILGSSDLTVSLLRMGLVDELRIMTNPIILGDGRSLFRTAGQRIGLKLLKTRSFKSGNVLLFYQPTAG